MSKYRKELPQLQGRMFLSDGGLETTLIFHDGIDLPYFASFDLLKNEAGTETLRRYFRRYVEIAREKNTGVVLETATWRANAEWAAKLGYDAKALADANRRGVGMLLEIRDEAASANTPIVVSGNLGPRGDGYRPDARMSVGEAQRYHAVQVETFAQTDADMLGVFTMNYVEEAIGATKAARAAAMPIAVSFTVETDGRLPSGSTLADAIKRTEDETAGYPVYYMINCAHPSHFDHVLRGDGDWRQRIRGLRANASKMSHAELDESTELDAGDPAQLAAQYSALRQWLPRLAVVGGCCGTDDRHVAAIGHACCHA